jgi:hypothetical protein
VKGKTMKTKYKTLMTALAALGMAVTATTGFAQATHDSDRRDSDRREYRNYDPDRYQYERSYDRQFDRTTSRASDPHRVIEDWPASSKKAARAMMDKYGPPKEVTATKLTWENNGPWKRTIVHSKPVAHNFPRAHEDVLEQVIDYRVPVGKFSDLAAFDGSIVIDRTRGELTARCDMEEANILALNLADEVVTGKRQVASAREEHARQLRAMIIGQSAPLTEKLIVLSPTSEAADPDQIVEPARDSFKDKFRDFFDRF